MHDSTPLLTWDIFCKVVDNHGDLGVCWRLSAQLAAQGQRVRLWVDDAGALPWMAPGALEGHWPGVQVMPWRQPMPALDLEGLPLADVWIEAFGCEVPPEFLACFMPAVESAGQAPVWINLEYLSAESYVERMHCLPSPVLQGSAAGQTKWFFYPGFTPRTGGLLREPDLEARQAAFDRAAWLAAHQIAWHGERLVSLFCYEPKALGGWLNQLAQGPEPTRMLVTPGRAAAAVQAALSGQQAQREPPQWGSLSFSYLPYLPHGAYDELLWACDLNFVRGEDSVVRALWAGKPFVWHIYPQDDDAHHAKLDAFLNWLDAPSSLRHFHHTWNAISPEPLPVPDLPVWHARVQAARERLRLQEGLASQLMQFVAEKR
ncbi:elongation factor P maturation arginine rhamnosyltransferase EarP [Ottowia sp. VDI28]|uniref:elongation factor P maturation arginine rhamnosyltransferase EarP n=1 Tax=Ottowia sp. VDI28 TaxID=3133968 RepID=UPI003C2EB90A